MTDDLRPFTTASSLREAILEGCSDQDKSDVKEFLQETFPDSKDMLYSAFYFGADEHEREFLSHGGNDNLLVGLRSNLRLFRSMVRDATAERKLRVAYVVAPETKIAGIGVINYSVHPTGGDGDDTKAVQEEKKNQISLLEFKSAMVAYEQAFKDFLRENADRLDIRCNRDVLRHGVVYVTPESMRTALDTIEPDQEQVAIWSAKLSAES